MSTSIFTFDHGQKDLNKAIGVTEEYLEELSSKCAMAVKSTLFDENDKPNKDMSPSFLVETCAKEFSYSQLVILSSFYLNDRLRQISDEMENAVRKIKAIKLNAEDMPQDLKDFLDNLMNRNEEDED
jgi:hypothetical protein